jgi:signal transduction histidine kinase/ligand-binding sensor domain-containing protein
MPFLVIIPTILFSHFFCLAQDIHFNLVTRSKDDLEGMVLSMTQDAQGFLWLATDNGIYKYDGYQYSSYRHEPLNPNSPGPNKIEFITYDKTGYIWFSPYGSGLDRLDPVTGVFTHFHHNNNDPGSLSSDTVHIILQDHDGTLWIGTTGGLDKFDSKTNKFIHYKYSAKDPSSLTCNMVRAIYEDKQGTIWIGTGSTFLGESQCSGGLNKLNKKTGKFTRYMHDEKDPYSLIDDRVNAIFEDSRGNFWIGTAGDGLHTMDRTKGKFERHLHDPAHPDKLSRPPIRNIIPYSVDQITFITEDSKGRIWIGTLEGGINVYDPSTQKVSYYGADKNSGERLAYNTYWRAYKTRDNVIWISSWGNNLYKIDPYQNVLPHKTIGKAVWSFAEDDAHTLWLGTERGLMHKSSDGKEEQILIDKDASSLSNTIIYIEKDRNKFWIGTLRGLYLFDPATKNLSEYHHQAGNVNSLSSDTVLMIKKGIGNQLWISCIHSLDLLDIKSGTFTHFLNKSDMRNNNDYEVTAINIDKNQNVWAGTVTGLNMLNTHTGLIKKYLNSLFVYSILEDSKGDIWCAGATGFFKYDKEKDVFLRFIDESAIMNPSSGAGVLKEDHQQNLWFNTTNGIIRLNKERNNGVLFGKNQGVNGLALTHCVYVRQNGEILYGDTSGYFEIKPDLPQQKILPPFVTISNFLLGNEPVHPVPEGILYVPLTQTNELRLNHSQNTFSFEFTNIDFISAHEDARLLYKLQGYDNTWHKAGDEKRAYYFNMPPGNYIFKVKAFNVAGVAAEKDIEVVITPPWWSTWWAYTLYALTTGGIVYLLYRNRINQLKAKQTAQMTVMVATQEGERKRIAGDLHDEVGTKLSALKLFLSSLNEKATTLNNEEIKSLAESSEQFITEVMQDVRRLLLNLSPAVIEEFGYTVAVEGLVNKINETNQLYFTLTIFGMKQRLRKEYELALYRITQELINNILKHAEAKQVSLQIGQRDKQIILMIEDDGIGFDVNDHNDGYGLKNLEARTKLMQGTMTIDSKPGKGTSILIEIPYNFNGQ